MTQKVPPDFLLGLNQVEAYFCQQGDVVTNRGNGLTVIRSLADGARLSRLTWSTEHGLMRVVAGSQFEYVDALPPDVSRAIVVETNSELSMPCLSIYDGSLAAITYAYFNHDGSVSTRVAESCLRLALEAIALCEGRMAQAVQGAEG